MPLALLILLAATVVPAFSASYQPGGRDYHNFEGLCLDCHRAIPAPGAKDIILKRDVTVLCGKCHDRQDALSHPVDIKPPMRVPSELPLDSRGMVTCVTCHSVHEPGFGPSHIRTRVVGSGFCVLCHSGLDSKMHSISGVGAHMGGVVKSAFVPDKSRGVRLDNMSIRCMSCHDAILGSDTTVSNLAILRGQHSNTTGLTHPVGVSYAEAKRKYKGAYRDMAKLPPQIKFYGGRVGCGTCHSPYASGYAELVMSNYGSNLCLACHIK